MLIEDIKYNLNIYIVSCVNCFNSSSNYYLSFWQSSVDLSFFVCSRTRERAFPGVPEEGKDVFWGHERVMSWISGECLSTYIPRC